MSIDSHLDKFQIDRRERIKWIGEILREKKEIGLKIFMASMSVELGIRRKTVKEYLDDLATIGKIEIKDGKIRWVENAE